MPPKKQEEFDVNTLPPWRTLTTSIRFDCAKQRAEKLTELLKHKALSFQRNITREEIIQFAKDKGLYVDPTQLNDKQKKDTKFMSEVATELTPSLLGKAFNQLITELTIQSRKAKKDQLDGKNLPDPKAKPDPKSKKILNKINKLFSEDAKASKKDTKQPVQQEAAIEEKAPEKEYAKNFDTLYILFDYPLDGDEAQEIYSQQQQVNVVTVVKEKITNWGGVDMGLLDQQGDFEGDLKERMEDFIEGGEEGEQGEEGQPAELQQQAMIVRQLSLRSKEYCAQERHIVEQLKQVRSASSRQNPLRNLVVKEILMEMDLDVEEDTIKQFHDQMVEEICQFSLDAQQFDEWVQNKKPQPLVTKQAPMDPFDLEIEKIKQEALAMEQERLNQEELQKQQQEAAAKGKGGKKEAKKTDEDLLKEKQQAEEIAKQQEAKRAQIEQAMEQQKKMKEKMHLQYYRRQLNDVDLQKIGPGILLEVLLDQLNAEKAQIESGQVPISLEDEEDAQRVERILQVLEQGVGSQVAGQILQQLSQKQEDGSKSTLYKVIIDEIDEVEKRAIGSRLQDEQFIGVRVKGIVDRMCFAGLDRFQMPEIAEKSEKVRKAQKSKMYPFISVDVYEFERRQTLIRFEELMKEYEPEQEWAFGDRNYLERHNRNTLSQSFFKAMLYDPHMITRYNDRDDNLQIILYYKNPPGRILRKKWSAEWKVIPNLENWINYFKNSETNLKCEQFYDIDYEAIGNLHERSKVLYPSDNSLILCTKYQAGSYEHLRYKVIKESIVFGVLEERGSTQFWANFDDNSRMTVQLDDEGKASFNLTLPHGLVVRFMPNGDVIQKHMHGSREKKANQGMLYLYDNAETNHELEINRVITGQGSVIKYMTDGSIIVLYANGNVEEFRRNELWVSTNNRGLRKARKGEQQWALDSVPCAIKTDPESGCVVYIRDDQTMVIKYPDGSQLTQHKDGTKMLTTASQDQVIVEHQDFCNVRISIDRVKARTDTIIGMGSAYANVGFENIFDRSNDGRVVETLLMEGGRVIGYREKQELPEYKQYKTNGIHLYYMNDGGVAKIVDDGEVTLITGEERIILNERGENRPEGQDIDYWLQLFSVPEERRSGVFTAFLHQKILQTKDDESNYFSISSTGEVVSKISVSLNIQQQSDEPPQSPDIPDGDFIDEENKFLPPPKQWIPPRLFVVNNDNTGQEYLNEAQLKTYLRLKSKDILCTQIIEQSVPGIPNCQSHSFITQLLELKEKKQPLIQSFIPQTLDIIPKTLKKNVIPLQKTFTFRNLLKFQPFDKTARDVHQSDLEKYEIWSREQAKAQSEFGIIQKSEEEKDAEFAIQLRILEGRRTDYATETYDQLRERNQRAVDEGLELHQVKAQEESKIQLPKRHEKTQSAGGSEVQQAFLDLQRKAITKNIIQSEKEKGKKKDYDQYPSGFVECYFSTKAGIEVSKTLPPGCFNVQPKNQQRVMSEEEAAKTLSLHATVKVEDSYPEQQDAVIMLENPYQQSNKQLRPLIIKPSVFTQAEIEDDVKLKKKEDEAVQYRSFKKRDVNVYGQERKMSQTKKVPCLLKTNPKSELNQKYILTDSITENRVKICSMATRVYQQAPSISEMRNEGMHQTIIKTIDKKNNLEELVDKKNLMIQGDLNDVLRKDLSIIPISVRFGTLKQSGLYQTKLSVKNEDILAQRIVIKQPKTKYCKVFLKQMGPISLGLIREVFVQLDAQAEIVGQFQDDFQIISKHQIYTIPISAMVVEGPIYEQMNTEFKKLNKKPLQKNYVKELRFDNQNKQIQEEGDSQSSDLLPRINYERNYKIDPHQYAQQNQQDQDISVDNDK